MGKMASYNSRLSDANRFGPVSRETSGIGPWYREEISANRRTGTPARNPRVPRETRPSASGGNWGPGADRRQRTRCANKEARGGCASGVLPRHPLPPLTTHRNSKARSVRSRLRSTRPPGAPRSPGASPPPGSARTGWSPWTAAGCPARRRQTPTAWPRRAGRGGPRRHPSKIQ